MNFTRHSIASTQINSAIPAIPATPDAPREGRFIVLVWLCLAAVIAYLQRTAIGVAAPEIEKSLAISKPVMGGVMSAYYWAYAVCQVPAGFCAGKLGGRRMLALSVGLTSLCAGLAGVANSAASFAFVWLLTGIAIAGIFPSCVRVICRWFPSNALAFPSGALSSSMSIGGMISTALAGWLLVELASSAVASWRIVFALFALPGVVWAAGFYLWFRDDSESPVANVTPSKPAGATHPIADVQDAPATGLSKQQADSDSSNPYQPPAESLISRPSPSLASVADVAPAEMSHRPPLDKPDWLFDRRTWLICTQQFFRAGGYVFYATWFPSFLKEVHQVELSSAGRLTSLPLFGVVLGSALGGWLSDFIEQRTGSKRLSRQSIGILSHGLCGLLILAAQSFTHPISAVLLISTGSFIFALGSSGSYAITMDLGGSRSATLFALMNMCGNIGAALSPIVVGLIIAAAGWNWVLPFFGSIYIASSLCWTMLNPARK